MTDAGFIAALASCDTSTGPLRTGSTTTATASGGTLARARACSTGSGRPFAVANADTPAKRKAIDTLRTLTPPTPPTRSSRLQLRQDQPGFHEQTEFLVAHDIRRHEVDRVADGAQQHAARERGLEGAHREAGAGAVDLEGPDHPEVAEVAHARMRLQRRAQGREAARALAVGGDHPLALEELQHRAGRAAGEWVAGIRMRMQEAA